MIDRKNIVNIPVIIFILLVGCADEIPSHNVTLKVSDSVGVPVSANNPLANIYLNAYALTTDQLPENHSNDVATNADGQANFTLGEFSFYVNMFPADYIGANINFNVSITNVNYSESPIV